VGNQLPGRVKESFKEDVTARGGGSHKTVCQKIIPRNKMLHLQSYKLLKYTSLLTEYGSLRPRVQERLEGLMVIGRQRSYLFFFFNIQTT
jgi:hypothetical protein